MSQNSDGNEFPSLFCDKITFSSLFYDGSKFSSQNCDEIMTNL